MRHERTLLAVVVEDHPLMRRAICDLLQESLDLQVCASASSAEEALELAAVASADLATVDVSLPQMNGLQLVRAWHAAHPGLRCLMLSSHKERSYIDCALQAGACGYVTKDNLDELPEAVRAVLAGGVYLSTSVRDLDAA